MSKKARQRRLARAQEADQRRLTQFDRVDLDARIAQHPDTAYAIVQTRAVLEILSEGRTAAKAEEIGANAGAALAHNVGRLLPLLPEQPACRPGCAWCCTIPVSVTPPEALAIAAFLRATLPAEELDVLRVRLRTQAAMIANMTVDAHAEAQLPCALLINGYCSVYPARPLHCQGWSAWDARACEQATTDPWTGLKIVLPVYDMAQQAVAGLEDGCTRAGLDATSYELHSAVSCALETPDAAARWVRGAPVFTRCTPGSHGSNPKLVAARVRDLLAVPAERRADADCGALQRGV